MTLVDTNVLLDIATSDPVWREWSLHELAEATLSGPLLINPVIYAELSARYSDLAALDNFVAAMDVQFENMPRASLFLAGKAFQLYRSKGGPKKTVLPDFFVGAHAMVAQVPVLTRDRRRYATYFPTVELITPDQA